MKKFQTILEAYKYLLKNYYNDCRIESGSADYKCNSAKNKILAISPILNIDTINYIKDISEENSSVYGISGKNNKSFILEKRHVEVNRINEFIYNKILGNINSHTNNSSTLNISFDLDTLVGLDGLIESDHPFLMMNEKMFSITLKNPNDFHSVSVVTNLDGIIFGNYCHTPVYINNFVEDDVIIGGAFDDLVIGYWKELPFQNSRKIYLNMDMCVIENNFYKFNVVDNKYLY